MRGRRRPAPRPCGWHPSDRAGCRRKCSDDGGMGCIGRFLPAKPRQASAAPGATLRACSSRQVRRRACRVPMRRCPAAVLAGFHPRDAVAVSRLLDDLHVLAADGVAHCLRAVGRLLADHHFLAHAGLLADHRFLARLGHFDHLVGEIRAADSAAVGDRTALDGDRLVVQADLLLDRGLDHVAAHARGAAIDRTLADDERLLGQLHVSVSAGVPVVGSRVAAASRSSTPRRRAPGGRSLVLAGSP